MFPCSRQAFCIIPKSVKVASNGVLRIKFPLLPPFDPKSEQGSAILQNLTNAISSYDDVERGLMEPQVQKCKDNLDDLCTIYDRGTAFLIDDTKTIWTAFHNGGIFYSIMSQIEGIDIGDGLSASEFEKLKSFRFPIQLINKDGEVIFGDSDREYATIKKLNPFFFQGLPVASDPNFVDHVSFELSRPLNDLTPLRFAMQNFVPLNHPSPVQLNHPVSSD
jgi:hypothetical protein